MKEKCTAVVISQVQLAPGIYDMWLETKLAGSAVPGTVYRRIYKGQEQIASASHQYL